MTSLIPFFPNPGTQRGRRALVVLLWVCFAGYAVLHGTDSGGPVAGPLGAAALLGGFASLFALTRVLGLARGEDARELDERERANRDRAHYLAYMALSWLMTAVVLYAAVAIRVDWLWIPETPKGVVGALAAVAVTLGLLPVTILGWTEPDMHGDEEEDAPRESFSPRLPVPRARRIALGVAAAGCGVLAALAWLGIGPVPAEKASTVAGIATGMVAALLLLTRNSKGRRA